jgi:hypothetical protein
LLCKIYPLRRAEILELTQFVAHWCASPCAFTFQLTVFGICSLAEINHVLTRTAFLTQPNLNDIKNESWNHITVELKRHALTTGRTSHSITSLLSKWHYCVYDATKHERHNKYVSHPHHLGTNAVSLNHILLELKLLGIPDAIKTWCHDSNNACRRLRLNLARTVFESHHCWTDAFLHF